MSDFRSHTEPPRIRARAARPPRVVEPRTLLCLLLAWAAALTLAFLLGLRVA